MESSVKKKKWSLRDWLRGVFHRSPKTTTQVTTPPVPYDPPSPTSNLTKAEKRMIMKAMRGCWYVCSRNHPYLVGNCGVPMETASCPTCGVAIGGKGHTITGSVFMASGTKRIHGIA